MTTFRKSLLLLLMAGFVTLLFAIPAASGKSAKTRRVRCNENSESIQTNLEGSYPGVIDYPAGNLVGDATLEIGPMQTLDALRFNPFSIRSGASQLSGRITAISTCGYTTATVFLDSDSKRPRTPDPSRVMSLRVCKGSNRQFSLINATVIAPSRSFSFSSKSAVIADAGNWGHCGKR